MICLLAAYPLFLVVKFNGYLDFTGRYGIEQILARGTHPNNWVLMIDGDSGTTWGVTEPHLPSEAIVFRFRKARPITRLGFTNTSDVPSAPIKVFGSPDGGAWTEFTGKWTEKNGGQSLRIGEGMVLRFIRFDYAADHAGLWPITEVWFDE